MAFVAIVYSLEPAAAVAHDPVGTGLRLVTVQPSGLTHVCHHQSLCSDRAKQVWEFLRGRSTQVFVIARNASEGQPINICQFRHSSLQPVGSSRTDKY